MKTSDSASQSSPSSADPQGSRAPRAGQKRPFSLEEGKIPTKCKPTTPEEDYLELPDHIRLAMNELARQVWRKVSELDVLLWVEYVWTKVNLADNPSRCYQPIVPGIRIGNTDIAMRIG